MIELARKLRAEGQRSTQAIAQAIARAVTEEIFAHLACDPHSIESMLRNIGIAAGLDPIGVLACSPEIDTARLIRTARLERFEARGCEHLPEQEWRREDREIAASVCAVLTKRYAKQIRSDVDFCP